VIFHGACIIAVLLSGLVWWGGYALAQYYPPRADSPVQGPLNREVPSVNSNDETYGYGLPTMQRNAPGSTRGDPRNVATLPPEVQPETDAKKELPPQFRRRLVEYHTKERAGTIIVDTPNTYLYLVLGQGRALRYGIGVGREGFTWTGAENVSKMAEWPDWNPPEQMIERQPYLPRFMAGGEGNPLGARALYLGQTLYRIHGTNQPSTIGTFVSSGCIRLTNEDIIDLYSRVRVGTRVVVLLGGEPATAVATPVGSSTGTPPGTPSRFPPALVLPMKRPKSQEIAAKLRQVDILVSEGQSLFDAIRQVGVTEEAYHRWRQELRGSELRGSELRGSELRGSKDDQAKRPKEPRQEPSKRIVEGDTSVVRNTVPQASKPEFIGFEE
jgi:lipoprotein-anchoring transpeptidase ErfK/SrfK